jgi:hypothetical protein
LVPPASSQRAGAPVRAPEPNRTKEGFAMAKIGRFISDPAAGAYCQISLDSGEKLIVNHDKGGFKGGAVSISQVKWLGLASGATVFKCDLGSEEGKAALARLTRDAPAGSAQATPLGAFVAFIKDCTSIAEVKARCAELG